MPELKSEYGSVLKLSNVVAGVTVAQCIVRPRNSRRVPRFGFLRGERLSRVICLLGSANAKSSGATCRIEAAAKVLALNRFTFPDLLRTARTQPRIQHGLDFDVPALTPLGKVGAAINQALFKVDIGPFKARKLFRAYPRESAYGDRGDNIRFLRRDEERSHLLHGKYSTLSGVSFTNSTNEIGFSLIRFLSAAYWKTA